MLLKSCYKFKITPNKRREKRVEKSKEKNILTIYNHVQIQFSLHRKNFVIVLVFCGKNVKGKINIGKHYG